jgi:hypothetical protein
MSEQRYLYWHPGEPHPEKMPEKCEMLDEDIWKLSAKAPTSWEFPRRWPVTEAEWRTHHYCKAYGITVPDGWRVVGFGPVDPTRWYLSPYGAKTGHAQSFACPILERVEEWITPTDEDAKRRPVVQVSNIVLHTEDHNWVTKTLIAVTSGDEYLCDDGKRWRYCQMKKENKA